jgi:hypothetical protein
MPYNDATRNLSRCNAQGTQPLNRAFAANMLKVVPLGGPLFADKEGHHLSRTELLY